MKYIDAKNLYLHNVSAYCAAPTVEFYETSFMIFEKFLIIKFEDLDFDISRLTKQHIVDYIHWQRNRDVKNTSVRTYIRGVKAFFRFLWLEGVLDCNIMSNIKLPKADNAPIIPLSSSRVHNLLTFINKSPLALRNSIIFLLMLECGLRIGEVVRLNVNDINFDCNVISIIDTKNNKNRVVPLPTKLRFCINEYLSTFPYKGCSYPEPLIRDNTHSKRITKNGIEMLFSRLKRVDVNVHPHLLRHTFATSYIMGGGQLECLRLLLGHENYDITRQYLHLSTQMQIISYDIYKLDGCMFRLFNAYDGQAI